METERDNQNTPSLSQTNVTPEKDTPLRQEPNEQDKRLNEVFSLLEDYKKEFNTAKEDIQRAKDDLKDQKNYLLLGFIIVAVMAITMLISVFIFFAQELEKSNSIHSYPHGQY